MPSAAAYTSKLRSLASARNVKVQYPGGVSETHRPDRTMMCTDYTATAVDPLKQVVSTILGPESIKSATSVAVDSNHNVFILDNSQRCVFKLDGQTGAFSVYAGQRGAEAGTAGDGGVATAALFANPTSIAVNRSGDLFICDRDTHRIRRVLYGSRIIESYAGSGTRGYTGDGGSALSCTLNNPEGVSVDPYGNVLIADTRNHVIRRVSATDRIIDTVAGTGLGGLTGDCNSATIAELLSPTFAIADSSGAIYISDTGNSLVRVVNTAGVISSVAGQTTSGLPIPVGIPGYAGDGGYSIYSSLSGTTGLALDTYGNLFIADTGNNVIRKINSTTRIISTYAGTGVQTYGGDGSVLAIASFNSPNSLSIGPDGTWYIADTGNVRIRTASPGVETVYSPPWFAPIAYRILRSKYDPATRSLLTYCECPGFATFEPTPEPPPNNCFGFAFLNGGSSNIFYTLTNDTFGGTASSNWREANEGESPPPYGENRALRFGRNDFYAGTATDYRG